MIIEQQKQATIIQHGIVEDDTIKMSLDLDSTGFIMQMLSKSLYSDPIGSLIRESVSNALDSHRKIKTTSPIIVNFESIEGKYEFSVEDKGIGLNHEDVVNIISKYGKSTKRNDNTQIGGWGLGIKSPLAYNNSFFLVCRKDGVERKYMMYEGEDKNSIDLLYESKTTESNGVKIIVPVDYSDRWDFINKIKEQLCYFQNVYFNVPDISNDFTISREKDFQYSTLCPDNYLHMTLDDVYYPLDYKALGIERIKFPVALKFSLTDGIYPLPNRESIRYTKESIELIKAKITALADYYVNIYNKEVKDCNNPLDYYKALRNDNKYVSIGTKSYSINELSAFYNIPVASPVLKGFSLLNVNYLLGKTYDQDKLLKEYGVTHHIDGGRLKECKGHYDRDVDVSHLVNRTVIFTSETIKGPKKEYLKELYSNKKGYYECVYIIKKHSNFTLYTYKELINLYSYPKSQWRNLIKEFQQLIKGFENGWINADTLEVPQEWLDARKAARAKSSPSYVATGRKIKLSGEITVKKAEKLERYVSGKHCKWVNHNWDLSKICKNKSLIVYGQEKDMLMMDKLFDVLDMYRMKTKITLLQITDREMKIVKDLNIHNLISFDKFMEGKNKPFKRLVTAYLIHKLSRENRSVFEKYNQIKHISTDLGSKIKELDEYKDNHFNRGNDEMWNAMLAVAEEHNLWDETIYSTYQEVKNTLERLPFLEAITYHMSHGKEAEQLKALPLFKAMIDLCKYHKFKINSEHYMPIPVLTEETILETI